MQFFPPVMMHFVLPTSRTQLVSLYVAAAFSVAITLALRTVLDPLLQDSLPYYPFYFAICAATVLGGVGPGLFALSLAFVLGNYFFQTPRYMFDLTDPEAAMSAFRFLSLGFVIVMMVAWGRKWRSTYLEVSEKVRVDQEKRRQQEANTRHLLTSLGDALLTVDTAGHVTYMNPKAESLSGWSLDEACGRPAADVLPLIRGNDGARLPDPLEKAMREGSASTLPPGTWLRQRSGGQCPVDDSAAPIRNEAGEILGAVIVFREAVVDRPKFTVAALHLQATSGWEILDGGSRQRLHTACCDWIKREWHPSEHTVRMVHLNGYDLIIRQDSGLASNDGTQALSFTVRYERKI